MPTNYECRYACNPMDFKTYDTSRIRQDFLFGSVLIKDEINLCYTHYDRYIAGGALPHSAPLVLESIEPLKADFFLQRREMGVINIGQKGQVAVDGKGYTLDNQEALYIGRGCKDIVFSSSNSNEPAKFYINSAPAHKSFPTTKIGLDDAQVVEAGNATTSNARSIRKMIVSGIVDVCQLQMGITELKKGSVWNTMPCHTHDRRMEVYFYFDMDGDSAVCHFMGEPEETRAVWMKNEQAIISPPWSIHCGTGTAKYSFIWSMAGENLDYNDMDMCEPLNLR